MLFNLCLSTQDGWSDYDFGNSTKSVMCVGISDSLASNIIRRGNVYPVACSCVKLIKRHRKMQYFHWNGVCVVF